MRARFDSPILSDDRSVSIVLNYILVLSITVVLVTGLLIAGGSFVEDNRERVIHSELTVIGNHIAGNLEQVDRMASASQENFNDVDQTPERAYINQTFQRQVTGATYTIEGVEDEDQIVLRTFDPEVVIRVNVSIQNEIEEESFASSGSITVYWDDNSDKLVIDDV